jgi:hypothetical protein
MSPCRGSKLSSGEQESTPGIASALAGSNFGEKKSRLGSSGRGGRGSHKACSGETASESWGFGLGGLACSGGGGGSATSGLGIGV